MIGVPAKLSHQGVVRDPKKPCRRIVRQGCHRPGFEGSHQGGLNGVLNVLNVLHTHSTRQRGHELAIFVPEKVRRELGRGQGV